MAALSYGGHESDLPTCDEQWRTEGRVRGLEPPSLVITVTFVPITVTTMGKYFSLSPLPW